MKGTIGSLLAAAVLAVGIVPTASPAGGTLLTSASVGALEFGTTPANVERVAGKPQHVWRFAGNGELTGNGLFLSHGTAYGYDCLEPVAKRGCATVYAFKGKLLIGFWTRSPGFHTAAGTRVGTSLAAALRQEKGERWFGFGVQCPAIDLSGTGPEFKADVTRSPSRVSDFLVTLAPRTFADGC